MPPTTGPTIFRTALLLEATANTASILSFLLAPTANLTYIVRDPAQITPATESLLQWIAGLTVVATAPLLLSYPENDYAGTVTERRRLTYLAMGASEVVLGGVTLGQWWRGGSGLTDRTLLTAMGLMGAFGGMRAFFLFVRPAWMEPVGKGKSQ